MKIKLQHTPRLEPDASISMAPFVSTLHLLIFKMQRLAGHCKGLPGYRLYNAAKPVPGLLLMTLIATMALISCKKDDANTKGSVAYNPDSPISIENVLPDR